MKRFFLTVILCFVATGLMGCSGSTSTAPAGTAPTAPGKAVAPGHGEPVAAPKK